MKIKKAQVGAISFVLLAFILLVIVVPAYIVFHGHSAQLYSSSASTLQENLYSSGLEATGDVRLTGVVDSSNTAQIILSNRGLVPKKIEYILVILGEEQRVIRSTKVNIELNPNTWISNALDLSDLCQQNGCNNIVVLAITSDGEIIKSRIYTQEELTNIYGEQNQTAYLTAIQVFPLQGVTGSTISQQLSSGGLIFNETQVALPTPELVKNGTFSGLGVYKYISNVDPKNNINRDAYVLNLFFSSVNITLNNIMAGNIFFGYHPSRNDSFNIMVSGDTVSGSITINNNQLTRWCDSSSKSFRIKILGFKSFFPSYVFSLTLPNGVKANYTYPPDDPSKLLYLSTSSSIAKLSLNGTAEAVYVYCATQSNYPSSYEPYILLYRTSNTTSGLSILFTTEDVYYGANNINDRRTSDAPNSDVSVSPLVLYFKPRNIIITNQAFSGLLINVKFKYHDNELDYTNYDTALDSEIFSISVVDSDGNTVGGRSFTLRELATTKITSPPLTLPQTASIYVPLPSPQVVGVKEYYLAIKIWDPFLLNKKGGNYVNDLDLTLLIESLVIIPVS
ncbi:MAG: hypothetical protein LM588_00950 [Fervidicoccaceae archaeon]|nr:hypothetical protein [Fervidicoccaceae archaeon]